MSARLRSSHAFCALHLSRFACRLRETYRCPWTAPQRKSGVLSPQGALLASIAEYIGARIGVATSAPVTGQDTGIGRDMRISRIGMAISSPTTGMATGTGHSFNEHDQCE